MCALWEMADYDRTISLELEDTAEDGSINKARCGGETAGNSLVNRGKISINARHRWMGGP